MSSQVGWRARRCVGHHHRVGPGPCGYILGTRGTFYEAAGAFAHNFTQNEPPATNLNSKFKSEVRKKSSTPPLPYTYKKTGPGHPLWIFRFGPDHKPQVISLEIEGGGVLVNSTSYPSSCRWKMMADVTGCLLYLFAHILYT